MKQIPLPMVVDAAPSFEDFVPAGNEDACAHVRQLAVESARAALASDARPRRFSMTYLWGPTGAGKTHLLAAAAALVQATGPRVPGLGPQVPLPWSMDGAAPLVLIDDCDRLDEDRQHAAFVTVVEAQSEGIAVLAAGRLPPVDLPLREDLRSRIGWGHVFAIHPLGEARTRAALRQAADRRGIFLDDALMDFLLTRLPRDLGSLMQLLDRIDEYSMVAKRPVTLALVRRMLAEAGERA